MRSVIEELFYGNIQPNERSYEKHPQFIESSKLSAINLEKLKATFNESQKEIFDKYCEAENEIDCIVQRDLFSYALKLGVLLTAESFMGMDALVGSDEFVE